MILRQIILRREELFVHLKSYDIQKRDLVFLQMILDQINLNSELECKKAYLAH